MHSHPTKHLLLALSRNRFERSPRSPQFHAHCHALIDQECKALIDHCHPSKHETGSRAAQYLGVRLIRDLTGLRLQIWAQCSRGNHFCIVAVVPLPLGARLLIHRGNDPRFKSHFAQRLFEKWALKQAAVPSNVGTAASRLIVYETVCPHGSKPTRWKISLLNQHLERQTGVRVCLQLIGGAGATTWRFT